MLVLAVCCGLVPPDCASGGPHLAMVWGVQSKVSSSCVVQGAFFNPLKLRMLDKFFVMPLNFGNTYRFQQSKQCICAKFPLANK